MIAVKRETHQIDARGKASGRLASQVAILLMGKNKPTYIQNVDAGEFVEVTNASALKFTGKKIEQKQYKWSAGYPGGLHARSVKSVFEKDPGEVLRRDVYNMLPRNSFRVPRMRRLKITK